MNAINKEHLQKPYESFSGEGHAPKDFFEPWAVKIENIIHDLRENNNTEEEILTVLIDVLDQYNYRQLNKDILQAFKQTEDEGYYWIFKRFYDATKLDCHCSGLEDYGFDTLYSLFFNEDESNAVIEILKKEVTPTLEFNGSKISIEEFMNLSRKVSETNKHLAISLLFNDVVKKGVGDGLTTMEDAFALKVQSYTGRVYSDDLEKFKLKEQRQFSDFCDGKRIDDTQRMLHKYYKAIKLLILHAENKSIPDSTPIGWHNLFIIKAENHYLIIGDFNSKFNSIIIEDQKIVEIGTFYKQQFTPLNKSDKFNSAKLECLTLFIDSAYENLYKEPEGNFHIITIAIQATSILKEKCTPDKKSPKFTYDHKVSSPLTEDGLKQI